MNIAAKKSAATPTARPYDYENRKPETVLRELIALAALSQRQAALELGVNERTMRYWCNGKYEPPRMAILALERLVDMQRQVSAR